MIKYKSYKHCDYYIRGFTLVETLVVLAVFSALVIFVVGAVLTSLRGARKSEALSITRRALDYATIIIERQLHNAQSISPCPNSDTTTISYTDQSGQATNFSCVNIGFEGYVASGSARLTNEETSVTSCSLSCVASGSQPYEVNVALTGRYKSTTGAEAVEVPVSTKVILRAY